MSKRMATLSSSLVVLLTIMLFVQSSPVSAKASQSPTIKELLEASDKQETPTNLEFTIIKDQEQIQDELLKLGIDYDEAIRNLETQTQGAGGHGGVMFCSGPNTANDLFLVSSGPFAAGFFGGAISNPIEIGGCAAAGVCDAFPACLINAVCTVPAGQTAILYAATGVFTTDLGWGCSP